MTAPNATPESPAAATTTPNGSDGRPYPNDSGWAIEWQDFPLGRQEWEALQ